VAGSEDRKYHHGNLRRAIVDLALGVIAADGVGALSLRDLARRLGVSHAAPRHHFLDKAALLTFIAAEGFERLAEELERAAERGFLEVGLAYVAFAVGHSAYVSVMFQPNLYRQDDPGLVAARQRAGEVLYGSARRLAPETSRAVGLAGWCLMHGLASLWLSGNLRELGDDPLDVARMIGEVSFRSPA
jgi:AcrR family transcriptional regulator